MNAALFRQTWHFQRVRLAFVSAGLMLWGSLLPIVYAEFGSQFKALMESGLMPEEFATFGGGDVFSLPGAVALVCIHPIAIILTSVFAVGFTTSAVAGERQRGTLELTLAHPLSRRTLCLTLFVASMTFVAVTMTALLAGAVAGSTFAGVVSELALRNVPLLWLNAVLLFGSFAAIGLAASVSCDRLPPALGVTLGVVVIMYAFEVVGELWPAADFLRPYSLFHYLQAKAVLTGGASWQNDGVLAVVIAAAAAWALYVFPRRDLAAPS